MPKEIKEFYSKLFDLDYLNIMVLDNKYNALKIGKFLQEIINSKSTQEANSRLNAM